MTEEEFALKPEILLGRIKNCERMIAQVQQLQSQQNKRLGVVAYVDEDDRVTLISKEFADQADPTRAMRESAQRGEVAPPKTLTQKIKEFFMWDPV